MKVNNGKKDKMERWREEENKKRLKDRSGEKHWKSLQRVKRRN